MKNQPQLDAVVLDVKMPGMDASRPKHIAATHPGVAVLMLSGHAHVGDHEGPGTGRLLTIS
jgi:DNA-binding NtrC family response regulator